MAEKAGRAARNPDDLREQRASKGSRTGRRSNTKARNRNNVRGRKPPTTTSKRKGK